MGFLALAGWLAVSGCSSDQRGGLIPGSSLPSHGTGGKANGSGGAEGQTPLLDAGSAGSDSGAVPDASAANGTGGNPAAPIGVSPKCLTCLAGDRSCGAAALSACKVTPTCGGCLTDLKSKGTGSGCRDTPLLSSMGVCANQNCPDECDAERAGVWMP